MVVRDAWVSIGRGEVECGIGVLIIIRKQGGGGVRWCLQCTITFANYILKNERRKDSAMRC